MTSTTRKIFLDPPEAERPAIAIDEVVERAAIELCREAMSDLMVRVEGANLEVYASFGALEDKHVVLQVPLEDVLMSAEPELGFGEEADAKAIQDAFEATRICRITADKIEASASAAMRELHWDSEP